MNWIEVKSKQLEEKMRRFWERRKIMWNFLPRPLIQLWKFYYLFWRREKFFSSKKKEARLHHRQKGKKIVCFGAKVASHFLFEGGKFSSRFFPTVCCVYVWMSGKKAKRDAKCFGFSFFSSIERAPRKAEKSRPRENFLLSFSISLRPQFGGKIFAFLRFTGKKREIFRLFSFPSVGVCRRRLLCVRYVVWVRYVFRLCAWLQRATYTENFSHESFSEKNARFRLGRDVDFPLLLVLMLHWA